MKRRDFISKSAGLTAFGLLGNSLVGEHLFASVKETGLLPAYDDNRVIRVYNPKVTSHNFTGTEVYWKTIDPDVLHAMVLKSLAEISGEHSETKGWKKILSGNRKADLSGKRLVVKVNFNNTERDIHTTLNNSPAMMAVLAKSLTKAGMKEENICFFDCSRPFPDEFKTEVRSFGLSSVVMNGQNDNLAVSDRTIFLSDNKGILRDGKSIENYPIPQCLIDADYLINLHLVKIHGPGVTGAMKNLFGLSSDVGSYMHHLKGINDTNLISDISLNEDIQKRARLNIAEFIFGGHTPDTIDKFTNEEFFPGGIPSSLIVSRSPFYHDIVLYNFVKAEYQTSVPVMKRFKKMGPDTWLRKACDNHAAWKYESAGFVETNSAHKPSKDLSFKHIEYKTI